MAFCFGRQFRRIAAQALTADPDEMRLSIACILPPREDGGGRVLDLKSEADCELAPAVIVAAFFADLISGDEAADLLARAMDPAFRKKVLEDRGYTYAPWGPPISFGDPTETARNAAKYAAALVKNNGNTSAPCCDAKDGARERPP